ncbi:MAG TPA: type IVB secretion system protein IcmH/DotU [Steroidobacteraceae bacterium]|nr:type IVB secretion system protein IcmH/DotU [Steroidobacteraceae bacterium]
MNTPPDDPFAPSDATILRPRPGRRPGTPAAGAAPAAPTPNPAPAPTRSQAPQGVSRPPVPPDSSSAAPAPGVAQFISTGRNPLLQAAGPLLVLAGRLRGQIANADVESLRRQCMQEIRDFEGRCRSAGVPDADVLAARYALCTVLDEAVLNTPWGAQSGWAGQSLLVTFHREAQGGEKFFQLLERLLGEPQRYLALLELWYVCLSLGFEGLYRLDERGANRLADIRRDLYLRIEQQRGGAEPALSPHWTGVEDRRNAVLRLVPLWVVAAAAIAILVGAWLFFDSRLNDRSAPISAALANVGLEHLEAATPANAPPTGLATLLAPQIAQQLVAVQEQGARTSITVTVPDLFASGSTRVNARFDSLVHAIGAALVSVPGRILVIGHTDDQPVHSLQFQNNYELSQARAVAMAKLLERDVTDASRFETIGKGDSDPLYRPANLPQNRARNRRVEIVLLRGM